MVANEKNIDHLKQEIEELKSMLAALMSKKEVNKDAEKEDDEEDVFEKIKILQEDYIKVMSLCPMELNISTGGMGKGKRFRFDKFGDIKRILYSDLVDIMESNANFLNYGFFYIMDERVIRKHGLDDVYNKMLTKDKIEAIISGSSKDAIDLFKSANKNQQEFICNMLIAKIRDSHEIDLNLIDKISRVSGINLQEKGEEAKYYSQVPEAA